MDILNFFNTNPDFFLAVVAILGLFIGSFLNVVIYRLPRMMEKNWSEECRIYLGLKPHHENEKDEKLDLCLPASHCPHCKKPIKPWHNIPLFSYIWLQGKCHHCKGHISLRYPLIEALTCVLSTYVAWRFGIGFPLLGALIFTWTIICLTFIDLDHRLLPDELTLFLLWVGLFCSLFSLFVDSHTAIIGAIAGYLIFYFVQFIFYRVTGKVGMGQGDFKFLAALGAFLGWEMLPLIILLASISGMVVAFTQMTIKRHYQSIPIPFGPYLAIAGWIALIFGNEILHYYLVSVRW